MQPERIREFFRRDGWLLAALISTALLCLALGAGGGAQSTASTLETQLARVLSAMEGAGKVEVAIFCDEESDAPCGAVVVAQGADDVSVRLSLARAVCTLLGLENSQVDIFKLGGNDP